MFGGVRFVEGQHWRFRSSACRRAAWHRARSRQGSARRFPTDWRRCGSAIIRARRPVSTATLSPSVRRSRSRHAGHQLPGVQWLGIERLLTREGEQSLRQRRRAAHALHRRIGQPYQARGIIRQAALSNSILLLITVRWLLKSCAMPPVSRPTASIFCAWRNASSACSRRRISACNAPKVALSRRARRAASRLSANKAMVAGTPNIKWRRHQVAPGDDDRMPGAADRWHTPDRRPACDRRATDRRHRRQSPRTMPPVGSRAMAVISRVFGLAAGDRDALRRRIACQQRAVFAIQIRRYSRCCR